MYDFHTHTIFSDGVLLPSELVQRAKDVGYKGMAITDHVDFSNMEFVVENLYKFYDQTRDSLDIEVVVGVEITHVPPRLIEKLVYKARNMGVSLVVVHGETLVEPVEPGTNRAAIDAEVDILAHPGLISEEDVNLAVKNGVYLELTTRKGHCYTNGHVVALAKKYGAKILINNDAHEPQDLVPYKLRQNIALGAGLSLKEFYSIEEEAVVFFKRLINPQTMV